MNVLTAPRAGFPLWVVRRAPWFLAVLVTASAALPVVAAIGDLDHSFPAPPPRSQSPVLAIAAGLGIWALQLRHSLAAARGVRPAGWPLSLLALALLAGAPAWWFSVNWISALWFPLAAAVMVLRGRTAAALVTVALVAQAVVAAWATAVTGGGAVDVVVIAAYNTVFLGFGVGALYWSALLVNRIEALFATRADLAHSAISGDRQRMSRDLHDLLGQSLSAVSLKGDLALRLLPGDGDAALREVHDIAGIVVQAQQGVRAIARAAHDVALRTELDGAVALLEAGGVEVHTRLELPTLTDPVNALFAWAVREATTNVLRHSHAQRCWVTGRADTGLLRLEIVNDGATAPDRPHRSTGSGLTGLTARAGELAGHVRQEHHRGRFRLTVEVPAAPQEVA
ncbi:MAG: sensor histidine kinase [Micromonosporaceae bacterium]